MSNTLIASISEGIYLFVQIIMILIMFLQNAQKPTTEAKCYQTTCNNNIVKINAYTALKRSGKRYKARTSSR